MIKFTILLRRKPSMTHEEFVAYHREQHAPLFCSLPVVQRYVHKYVQQHTLLIELPSLPPAKYDGITELWFDDAKDIGALFNDPDYLAQIRPDEERFLDLYGCDFIVSQEHTVL